MKVQKQTIGKKYFYYLFLLIILNFSGCNHTKEISTEIINMLEIDNNCMVLSVSVRINNNCDSNRVYIICDSIAEVYRKTKMGDSKLFPCEIFFYVNSNINASTNNLRYDYFFHYINDTLINKLQLKL